MKNLTQQEICLHLQTFRGFCQMRFCDFVAMQIQQENNFLPASKHRQAKVRRFLALCLYDCFIYRSNFVVQKFFETRHHLRFRRKRANSQGYSELQQPIKTRENCYSLIWYIVKSVSPVEYQQYLLLPLRALRS